MADRHRSDQRWRARKAAFTGAADQSNVVDSTELNNQPGSDDPDTNSSTIPFLPPPLTSTSSSEHVGPIGRLLELCRTSRIRPRSDETPWQRCSRELRAVRDQLSVACKVKKRNERFIKDLKDKQRELCRLLFEVFSELVGVPCTGLFDKKSFDEALEQSFGSLDKDPTFLFKYQGKEYDLFQQNMADRIFSIYLCRKVLVPQDPDDCPSALSAFFERTCSGARPETQDTPVLMRMFKRLLKIVLDEASGEFAPPTHKSACVERKRADGGKRQSFYFDEDWQKRLVEPEAIFTGGKIRVITKDSAWNMRYAFLNKWMASKIRRFKWCIFGRDVSTWLEQCPEFLSWDGPYCSGDLESATDLFNSDFARAAIEHIAEVWDLDEEEVEQMKAFTTDAIFEKSPELYTDERGEPRYRPRVQKAGQLMGSILSFPILCLISTVCALFSSEGMVQVFETEPDHVLRKILENADFFGVNGDDVVFWDDRGRERSSRWVRAVLGVGGKVSRGKSLRSDRLFTVNSELWTRLGIRRRWCRPGAIRPSILVALADGEVRDPSRAWLEYSQSPLLTASLERLFNVRSILRPHLPVTMGGTGQEFAFDVDDVLRALIRRQARSVHKPTWVRPPKFWEDWVDPWKGLSTCVTVVTRGSYDDYVRLRYDTDHRPAWSTPPGPWYKEYQKTMEQMFWEQRTFITNLEIEKLKRLYEREFFLGAHGLVEKRLPVTLSRLFGFEYEVQSRASEVSPRAIPVKKDQPYALDEYSDERGKVHRGRRVGRVDGEWVFLPRGKKRTSAARYAPKPREVTEFGLKRSPCGENASAAPAAASSRNSS